MGLMRSGSVDIYYIVRHSYYETDWYTLPVVGSTENQKHKPVLKLEKVKRSPAPRLYSNSRKSPRGF